LLTDFSIGHCEHHLEVGLEESGSGVAPYTLCLPKNDFFGGTFSLSFGGMVPAANIVFIQ
jgi:hypothetical protein